MYRAVRKGWQGQITLMAALMILVCTALILLTVEQARLSAVRWNFRNAVYSAGESVLAGYHTGLWEDYRLLMRYEDEEMESDFNEYLTANAGGSLLSFTDASGLVTGRKRATDEGGVYLVRNAAAFMKYEEGKSALSDFLDQSGLLKQIKKAASFIQTLLTYGQQIIELEETFSSLKKAAEGMQSAATLMDTAGSTLETGLAVLSSVSATGEAASDVERLQRENAVIDCQSAVNDLLVGQSSFASSLGQISTGVAGYGEMAVVVSDALDQLLAEMDSDPEAFTGIIRTLMQAEIEHLRSYASASEEKEAYLAQMTSYAAGSADLAAFAGSLSQVAFEEITPEQAGQWKTILGSYRTALEDYTEYTTPSWLAADGTVPEISLATLLIRIVTGIFTDGTLALFVEDTSSLSTKEMSMADRPSLTMRTEASGDGEDLYLHGMINRLLFADYLTEYFGSYTKPGKGRMDYEWEYMLFGRLRDRDNLARSTQELFLVREGTRFLENLQDTVLRKRAEEMATTFLSFTGNAAVIYVGSLLLLGVWASDDATEDVRLLLKGEPVPFLELDSGAYGAVTYEDYWKLRMLLAPVEDIAFRAMDLIQYREREEDSDFCMNQCLTEFQVSVSGESDWMFAVIPVVSSFGLRPSGSITLGDTASFRYQ